MTVPARISIVTLGVEDLARSVAFYLALGWDRSAASQDGISWFRTADSVLGLFPYEELAADAALPAPPRTSFGGITLAINVETEEAVETAMADAVAAGARVIKPAQRTEWGGVSGYFCDPDGYPWEVAHNPFFPINPDGSLDLP